MNIMENIFAVVFVVLQAASIVLLAWIILSWAEIAFNTPLPNEPPTYSEWNIFTMI